MPSLFGRSEKAKVRGSVDRLYRTLVAQARRPQFYLAMGVPDTPEGRFDLIALHAFVLLRRLRREGAPGTACAQLLFDRMFADMDDNLREMGVGDLGVGRQVKALAAAFYGRIAAYDAGLDGSDEVLGQAFRRNLYRLGSPSEAAVAAMASYLRREAAALGEADGARLMQGELAFGQPPILPAPV